jgi:hypothetical protein
LDNFLFLLVFNHYLNPWTIWQHDRNMSHISLMPAFSKPGNLMGCKVQNVSYFNTNLNFMSALFSKTWLWKLSNGSYYLLTYLLTHSLTHSLTLWCRILFEKLIITQLIKRYPAFLWNPKVHHHVHKSLPLDPIPS